MCFSAPASFITSGILGVAGFVTTRKAKTPSELPLASIPFIFAIQQFFEGMLWVTLAAGGNFKLLMAYGFLIFAFIVWPVFIPIAVYLAEKNKKRRMFLKVHIGVGLVVGAYLMMILLNNPIEVTIIEHSVRYLMEVPLMYYWALAYLFAVCGSALISSHKMIAYFGFVSFLAYWISYYFYIDVFTSVWCFMSAILSLLIYAHFMRRGK
jgi:uncharacterized protein DUF6629